MEQRKIIQNATRRNKLKSGGNDVNDTIEAEGNLQDVIELLANLRKNKEPLLHCSVFIELKARSMDALKELQSDIAMELTRSKISVDRLTLRQKEGFLSVIPTGYNQFGAQYERVLPASSVANLYPFNFSGKTDPQGLYLGRDKYGTNILVDFDRRAEDKTTSNVLILGNSGQGKSYLLKLILTNIRESGKAIICLDPESEYEELCNALPVQEGHDQQRRATEILRREQSSRNHRLRNLRQSAGGNGKTVRKAKGQAGRHENRTRPILQQIRTNRASDLRRMRNAISQMHLGSQRQEKGCMALHQPT